MVGEMQAACTSRVPCSPHQVREYLPQRTGGDTTPAWPGGPQQYRHRHVSQRPPGHEDTVGDPSPLVEILLRSDISLQQGVIVGQQGE